MKLWTIIKKGSNFNYSLCSIKFDSFGKKINNQITICDDWMDGIKKIQNEDYTHILLVNSGTVFYDWQNWLEFLESYPAKDFVGHLIWNKNNDFPYLNDQCTLVSKQNLDIFLNQELINCPKPIASSVNLHDDYTPLYIKGDKKQLVTSCGIIANALAKKIPIVNWNPIARSKKTFLYNEYDIVKFLEYKSSYTSFIEKQLWVLNNEPVDILDGNSLLTVGSGLFWIINIIQSHVKKVTIVDISETQIKFCTELWQHWDGNNYGEFAYDFIKKNSIQNFQLDNISFSKLDFIKFKRKDYFINYVNEKFSDTCKKLNINNFSEMWMECKSKTFECKKDNIFKYNKDNYESTWFSNAKDFKWTLLHA